MANRKSVIVLKPVWTSEGKLMPGEHKISGDDFDRIEQIDKATGVTRVEAVKRRARNED